MATTAKKPVKKAVQKSAPKAEKSAPAKTSALPKELFGAEVNQQLLATAVRVFLANQREGSAKTKTRGEVEGSSRKIYKQKGTGRARHGSIRAHIFVGGGVVFGPEIRNFHLKMSKSMRRGALLSALSSRASDTVVLSGLDSVEPKTKLVAAELQKEGVIGSVLLVVSKEATNLMRAAQNIRDLTLIPATDLNPYMLLTHKKIVFTKKSLDESVAYFGKKS